MRIGIAGLGTVGCGLIEMIEAQGADCPLKIIAVSARSRHKKRSINIDAYEWFESPLALAGHQDIDCVVEVMGGSEGAAKELAEAALQHGKAVVTANKALIADYGYELAALAERHDAFFGYEAAVAGGIPVIKALRESFSGNKVQAIRGILNGTCNYILSTMRETGRSFDDVLQEAQKRGYAESDPRFDIDGIDAAHKLAILAALAFGVRVPFAALPVTGIRDITAADISYAREMGYRIKLLGLAEQEENGENISLSVEPCFVDKDSPIAYIEDVLNAVMIDAHPLGQSMLVGSGAGAGPTASSVFADLTDAVHGVKRPLYGRDVSALKCLPNDFQQRQQAQTYRYYMRLAVQDVAGVVADIAAILRDHDISISDMIQHGRDEHNPVDLVLLLHETSFAKLAKAKDEMQNLPSVIGAPMLMRILS